MLRDGLPVRDDERDLNALLQPALRQTPVENGDLVALPSQPPHGARADEAGTADHEDTQSPTPRRSVPPPREG